VKQCLRTSVIALAVVVAAEAASAQTAPAPPPQPPSASAQMQARYNIAVLEAVFETAVQRGAQMLREGVQGIMPDMMILTGVPRARGVRLEGYGVFFSVDVPGVSPTVAWTVRTLNQNDVAATNAIQQFRNMLRTLSDRRQRDDLDRFLRQVALQMGIPDAAQAAEPGAMPPPGMVAASGVTTGATEPQAAQTRPSVLDDPFGAYESAVKQALIDAMLDHSGPLEIGSDEWLTVAARDNEDRRLSPNNVYDLATIVLRIKGSDLAAFRSGRLTREEARAKVEVREL
jgi:hypothetical protein